MYEISREIDVFVAFETMNNRGKPLSVLELLKNRLIYLVMQIEGVNECDSAKMRRNVNYAWKTVYHFLGKNEKRPLDDDSFLKAHLWYYYHKHLSKEFSPNVDEEVFRYINKSMRAVENTPYFLLSILFSRKRLAESNEDWKIDIEFLQGYSQHLKETSEVYYKLSTPMDSSFSDNEKIYLERIGRLQGYAINPLILAVYLEEKNAKKRALFLEVYERLVFCLSIKNGWRAKAYYHNPEWIKLIKGQSKVDDIVQYMQNTLDEMFKDQSLNDLLYEWMKAGLGYYNWKSINYFLYEYELELQSSSKTSREKISWDDFSKEDYQNDFITVEHIYPQRARAQYWKDRFDGYKINERKMLRNSLGNLLALSRPKNSSLGNKPFPDKVGRLTDTVGYRFGGYSENEVAIANEWTAVQILERGLKMLDFFESRWHLSLGDRAQKIRALGLHFLKL